MMINVLLADDHTGVRKALRMILDNQSDIQVIGEVTDGKRAVSSVHQLKPDVIIMDISMPELNGIEAARQILAENQHIKVVILSMHCMPEYIFRTMEIGVMGYLLKESASLEMIDAVKAAYQGQRYLSKRITNSLLEEYLQLQKKIPDHILMETLTRSELEVYQLVLEGSSSAEIAESLSYSCEMVKTYRREIMEKLVLENPPALLKFALQNGIMPLD
jgi:DNA-binding NarL/FixJ family response regulator